MASTVARCALCQKVTKLVRGSGFCAKCWKKRLGKRGGRG